MCTTDVGKVAQLLEAELRKVDGGRPVSSTVSEAKKKMAAAVQWASETSGVSLASAKTAIKEDSGGSRMQPSAARRRLQTSTPSIFANVKGVHGLGHAKGTQLCRLRTYCGRCCHQVQPRWLETARCSFARQHNFDVEW
jgi:hypothetical protein